MAFASSEVGPSTPRKTSKESCRRNAFEIPEVDEALRTPLLEIPTQHSTPQVNWSEYMYKFRAGAEVGSPDPETPNPLACGGNQAFAARIRQSAPSSVNTEASHCWQQWLSSPPPCPLSLEMTHIVESSSRQQEEDAEPREPHAPVHGSLSSSMPWSLSAVTPAQHLPSPWNPAARLGAGGILLEDGDDCPPRNSHTPPRKSVPTQSPNETTPRKLVCSRGCTPPPTRRSSPPSTKRSSPPFSICRRSPLLPTPFLFDEVESPWKLHKVDTSTDDEAYDSSPLRIAWPPVSPNSLPWGGDLDGSLSPASSRSEAKQDQENCDPNSGRFHRDFRDVTAFKKGKCTTFYRAEHKIDRQIYAVREHEAANRMEQQVLLREVETIAAICSEGPACPNLLQYYSAWLEDASLHVQTELFECSLRDRLETNQQLPCYRSNAQETLALLRDVTIGLATLHGRGLAHTDVRPENILMTKQGGFKVGGLGRCTKLSVLGPPPIPASDEFATDHFYRAPQALWLGGDVSDLPKADVFSSALVICEFAMCPTAFPGDSCEWQQLRSGCLSALMYHRMPEALVTLLRRMLIAEPSERPDCRAIGEHAEELRLSAGHFEPLLPPAKLSEAALISYLRKQREEHLREGLRQIMEAEEFQRKRAESLRLELEAMRKRVAQQNECISRNSDFRSQGSQSRSRSFSWEPKQAQESHGR